MNAYSISFAVEVAANSYEEAYAIQESLIKYLLNRDEVASAVEIDVEELDV